MTTEPYEQPHPSQRPQLPLAGQPDPSYLTTEALNREIGYLRTLLEAQVESARDMAQTLRKSDEKFQAERDRRITEVKIEVEKFEAERDRRISEVKQESDRRLTEVATEREKALKIKE